ncbi:hypothetical protein C0995_002421 [Termitomyces sp. Mi166|nr:hypothetical protein C0995_002421 [Termitomyces sp. Mi166\
MSGYGATPIDPARARDTAYMSGFRTSRETRRLFMFSELELTDDDQFLHTATADLGTIKLEIWRCEILGESRNPTSRVYTYSDPQKIHERSKKALGHGCKLGPDVCDIQKSVTRRKHLYKVATFEFKYRPLAHLQASGIIPLDRIHKRATEPNEILDLSRDDDDDEALEARRIRALRDELGRLEERQRKRQKCVKAEPHAHVKAEAGASGDFIDLTI